MVTLPVAFLSLVPAGTVDKGVYDGIKLFTALFPFKPALPGDDRGARPGHGAGIGGPRLHFAILILAYGVMARFALRRFARLRAGASGRWSGRAAAGPVSWRDDETLEASAREASAARTRSSASVLVSAGKTGRWPRPRRSATWVSSSEQAAVVG